MIASRRGVARALSPDVRVRPPGFRSLRVRCASASMPALAPTARLKGTGNPSPPRCRRSTQRPQAAPRARVAVRDDGQRPPLQDARSGRRPRSVPAAPQACCGSTPRRAATPPPLRGGHGRREGGRSAGWSHLGCDHDGPSLRGPGMALAFAPAHPCGPASAYARLARMASHRRSRHTLAVPPTCQACGGQGWPRRRKVKRRSETASGSRCPCSRRGRDRGCSVPGYGSCRGPRS